MISKVVSLEKETLEVLSVENSHDGKEEKVIEHAAESDDEVNEEDEDDELDDDGSYICSEKRRSRLPLAEGFSGCARTN